MSSKAWFKMDVAMPHKLQLTYIPKSKAKLPLSDVGEIRKAYVNCLEAAAPAVAHDIGLSHGSFKMRMIFMFIFAATPAIAASIVGDMLQLPALHCIWLLMCVFFCFALRTHRNLLDKCAEWRADAQKQIENSLIPALHKQFNAYTFSVVEVRGDSNNDVCWTLYVTDKHTPYKENLESDEHLLCTTYEPDPNSKQKPKSIATAGVASAGLTVETQQSDLEKNALRGWLKKIGLSQYYAAMQRKGCPRFERLLEVNPRDLNEMGIYSSANRDKLFSEIAVLRKSQESVGTVAHAWSNGLGVAFDDVPGAHLAGASAPPEPESALEMEQPAPSAPPASAFEAQTMFSEEEGAAASAWPAESAPVCGEKMEMEMDIDSGFDLRAFFEQNVELQGDSERYIGIFMDNALDTWQTIRMINDADLKELGVKKMGHRKQIMAAIHAYAG